MYLSEEPDAESLRLLRERIESRLAGGASITTLAKEMGMVVPTVTAFRKHPKRRPQPDTWGLFRQWFAKAVDRSALMAHATIGVTSGATLSDAPSPTSVGAGDDVGAHTIQETAKTLERLSYIQGYAQSVLDQIYEVARRQQAVIDGLNPHVMLETRREAERIRAELDAVPPDVRSPQTTGKPLTTKPAAVGTRRRA